MWSARPFSLTSCIISLTSCIRRGRQNLDLSIIKIGAGTWMKVPAISCGRSGTKAPSQCCTVAAPVILCWHAFHGSQIIGCGFMQLVEGTQLGLPANVIGSCPRPGSRSWLEGVLISSTRSTSSSRIESRKSVRPHAGRPKVKPVNALAWALTTGPTDRPAGGRSFPKRLRPAGACNIWPVVCLRARVETERSKASAAYWSGYFSFPDQRT